jgi:hypothetical protein
MLRFLDKAGWIAAFAVLCIVFVAQVRQAAKHAPPARDDAGAWVCPILGKCGPPGTPGLGRW